MPPTHLLPAQRIYLSLPHSDSSGHLHLPRLSWFPHAVPYPSPQQKFRLLCCPREQPVQKEEFSFGPNKLVKVPRWEGSPLQAIQLGPGVQGQVNWLTPLIGQIIALATEPATPGWLAGIRATLVLGRKGKAFILVLGYRPCVGPPARRPASLAVWGYSQKCWAVKPTLQVVVLPTTMSPHRALAASGIALGGLLLGRPSGPEALPGLWCWEPWDPSAVGKHLTPPSTLVCKRAQADFLALSSCPHCSALTTSAQF